MSDQSKKVPFNIFAPTYPPIFERHLEETMKKQHMTTLANAIGVTMEMHVIPDPTFSSARAFLEEEAKLMHEVEGRWAGIGKEMLQDYLANVVIVEDEYVGNIKPRAGHAVLPTRHTWEMRHAR